jgi:cytoskeletal protein CcmA (bactofilin family)
MLRRYLKNPFQKNETSSMTPFPNSFNPEESFTPSHPSWSHQPVGNFDAHDAHAAQPIDPNQYFNRPDLMIDTIIGPGVSFSGIIEYEHLLRIDGYFEGELESASGSLIIGPRGVVKAHHLHLFAAVIEGTLEANLSISNLLVIKSTARIKGNIAARWLTLETGATINGSLTVDPNLAHKDEKEKELEQAQSSKSQQETDSLMY